MLPDVAICHPQAATSLGSGQYGGWCQSGEIDIMEHINSNGYHSGTAHYGGQGGSNHYAGCTFNQVSMDLER